MENNVGVLEQLNKDKTVEYLPAIIICCVIIVCGILGNSMSLAYYGFKVSRTSTNLLITSLSIIDLVTCVILIGEVIELCYSVNFRFVAGCKIMYFMNHWLVLTSGFMLVLIALDRYRKLCNPFHWQMSVKAAKLATGATLVLAGLLSSRDLFMIDVVRVNITQYDNSMLVGYYCTHSKSDTLQTAIVIFHILDGITFVAIMLSATGMYARISVTLFKHRTRDITSSCVRRPSCVSCSDTTSSSAKRTDTLKRDIDDTEESWSTISSGNKEVPSSSDQKQSAGFNNSGSMSTLVHFTLSSRSPDKIRSAAKRNFEVEKKISLMMICVFVTSIVAFIPHFVINLRYGGEVSEQEFNVGTQIALRLFMLNSAVNPFIMGVFNTQFRNYVKRVVCKCF